MKGRRVVVQPPQVSKLSVVERWLRVLGQPPTLNSDPIGTIESPNDLAARMFTMPGASPQSGMIEQPLGAGFVSSFFCSMTISVFPEIGKWSRFHGQLRQER